MHINYCEQGQTIKQICKKAASWGYDGIEFRCWRVGEQESREEYLDAVAKYTKKYDIRHILFGGPGINVMTQDSDAVRREIDNYKEFLDMAAARMELGVINILTGILIDPNQPMRDDCYDLHGSACAEEWHWEAAAAACRELGEYGARYGVKFAFETHMNYLHDTAASARKLVDKIDLANFGINLDHGNGVYFKNTPPVEEAIDICGDKLFYLHLKNSIALPRGAGRVPTALCDGAINHRPYVKKLFDVGYKGPIGIEAPRPGDREWFAVQDIAYLKALIEDLK